MINSIKEIKINDKRIQFYDHIKSQSVYWIYRELKEEYNLDKLKIEDNDVIIDIGTHVGVVSTYLSIANPKCKIYSYEPSANTFHCLKKNIEMNKVKNVKIHNNAITSDGRDVKMVMPFGNTGGSSHFLTQNPNLPNQVNVVKSLAINEMISNILKKEKTDKIKILKIDCEGSEYEILNALSPELFGKIEYLIGEFHTLKDDEVRTPQKLIEYCEKFIDPKKITIRIL